ncbi:protein disulfide oxidoreductase [Photobacterium indicum]|jgi:thiol-disulfide isomerase/thioredoxin|uniref:protein disulfide oxidoreductase n=1 Tax=Photobacterium indicum TaxID=81447 RepID=UPI001B87C51F|nr:protein disulfide oxidoreductase [Photobacterium indicum]
MSELNGNASPKIPQKKTENKDKKNKAKGIRHWLKEAVMFIAILTIFSTGLDIWRSGDMPSNEVPELITQTINDETIDLKAMSYEKPVLLYFWATWCPACKFVSPTVNWMSDHFNVVSVAITSGDNRRINAFMDNSGYTFPVINDDKGNISRSWGVSATPSIVIIKDGEISFITTGVSTPPGLWLRMLFA